METISDRLKALRIKHDYTLEEAGRHTGLSRQNLYKYENGIITNIPVEKIEKLADIYSVNPAYIMGWDKKCPDFSCDAKVASLIQELKDNPEYHALLEASRGLKSTSIKEIINFINYQRAKESQSHR